MDLETKLTINHKVEMPGAVLLALLEKMIWNIVDGMKKGDAATEDEQIDYAMGLFLFKEAQKVFGEKFIVDFCSGKDVIPMPAVSVNVSSTIN